MTNHHERAAFGKLVRVTIVTALTASACAANAGRTDAERSLTAYQAAAPIHAQTKQLLGELQSLTSEVELFGQHPGWADLAKLVLEQPAIEYVEGLELAESKRQLALIEWSRRWKYPAGKMLATYADLVNRSRSASDRRLSQLTEERNTQFRQAEIMASAANPDVRVLGYQRIARIGTPDTGLAAFLARYYLDSFGLLRSSR